MNQNYTASYPSARTIGFTLIELLVVISIIALLISILLPALQKARMAGRATQCLSAQRQIGVTINVYLGDFKNQFPVANGNGSMKRWEVSLAETYNMGWNIMYCPEDVKRKPTDYKTDTRYISYGYNILGLGFAGGRPNPFTGVNVGTFSARLDMIPKPGNTLCTVDTYRPQSNGNPALQDRGYYVASPDATLWPADFIPRARHDGVNGVFIDGHGKRMILEDVVDQDLPSETTPINKYSIWSPIH